MFWPVVIFMAISLVIGLYTYTQVHGSSQRYTVCGKSMPFLVVGTALSAQAIDGNATLGSISLAYANGLWAGLSILLGLALSLFIVGRFLAAPLNKMKLLTLPEFFYRRYGPILELMASVMTVICFIIMMAGNLSAVAWIFSVVAGISYGAALAITTAVIFTYTIAGGLYAAMWTDFFQIHVAIIGFVGACIYSLIYHPVELSDFGNLAALTKMKSGSLANWACIISLGFGNAMALDFMERVFSARSPKTARLACYYAGGWTIVMGFCTTVLGLAAIQLIPNIEDPRMVLSILATNHLPYMIGVLVFVGVVGASMSAANGSMLVISVVMARNLWQRWQVGRVTDSTMLFLSRVLAAPTAAAAAWIAYLRPEPGLLLMVAFDIVFAGCVIPLFFGVYWKRASAVGAAASIAVGTCARLACYLWMPEEELAGLGTLLPPILSLIVFLAASLLLKQGTDQTRFEKLYSPSKQDMLEPSEIT